MTKIQIFVFYFLKKTFQVTTLKRSIIRHGKDVHVEFTDNWSIDAQQRDLSINSLSMDEHGIVYDYTNGIDDLKMNRIRFNGNIITRLQENPIRILRYFRCDENVLKIIKKKRLFQL